MSTFLKPSHVNRVLALPTGPSTFRKGARYPHLPRARFAGITSDSRVESGTYVLSDVVRHTHSQLQGVDPILPLVDEPPAEPRQFRVLPPQVEGRHFYGFVTAARSRFQQAMRVGLPLVDEAPEEARQFRVLPPQVDGRHVARREVAHVDPHHLRMSGSSSDGTI
jgi:hypothetical protein